MVNEEKKSRFRSLDKERKKKNTILKVFIFVFIGGYTLFFTSNIWYPSNADMVKATAYNKEIEWNERKVSLLSWTYSKQQNLMEVQLEITNSSLDGFDQYEYEVLDRKKGYFTVEPILEETDFIVLHIKDLKRGWSELSLRFTLPGSEEVENTLKIYTNIEEVEEVDSIEVRSKEQYYAERIGARIDMYSSMIEDLQMEINDMDEQIKNANVRIAELKDSEVYQTEQQKKETEELIVSLDSDIQMMEIDIKNKEEDIKEYEERIKNAEKELEIYQ